MRFILALLAGVHVVGTASQRSEQVVLSSSVDSQKNSGIITPRIISYLRRALEENGVPGYSLLVVRPGNNLEEQHWNWGKRTEDGQPVDSNVSPMLFIHFSLIRIRPCIRHSSHLLHARKPFCQPLSVSLSTTLHMDATLLRSRRACRSSPGIQNSRACCQTISSFKTNGSRRRRVFGMHCR
jgi:hypothetical protein